MLAILVLHMWYAFTAKVKVAHTESVDEWKMSMTGTELID